MKYTEMTLAQRQAEYAAVRAAYEQQKALGLNLNMARGKPGRQQLDMVMDIFDVLKTPQDYIVDGLETRNYGEVAGVPAARALFAELLGCKASQVFVGGNASLQLMYDAVSKAFTHGLLHSEKPWCKLDKVKWICPVPGYDRHFKVTQSFGVEMISVPMTAAGPDMDMVEELVKDPAVKGMWNVPKYSNPEGVVYSDETIRRIAAMKPAAPDFMLMWDNAYCIHEFEGDFAPFADILSLCAENGLSVPCVLMMGLRCALSSFNDNEEDVSFKLMVNRRATLLEKKSGGMRMHFFSMRSIVKPEMTFLEALKVIEQAQNEVFEHSNLSSLEAIAVRHKAMDNETHDVYESMSFSYQPYMPVPCLDEKMRDSSRGFWYNNDASMQNLYLTVMHRSNDAGLDFNYEYRTKNNPINELGIFHNKLIKSILLGTRNTGITVGEILDEIKEDEVDIYA